MLLYTITLEIDENESRTIREVHYVEVDKSKLLHLCNIACLFEEKMSALSTHSYLLL